MTQVELSVISQSVATGVRARATSLVLGVRGGWNEDERGASLVEYALLMALIVVVCVAAIGALGGTTSEPFSEMQTGF